MKDFRFNGACIDDLVTILRNSIIRYKNLPVYVKEVTLRGDMIYLKISYLSNPEERIVRIDSGFLNFEPVPLGMANTEFGAAYVSRIPSRTYSQGLTTKNINVVPLQEYKRDEIYHSLTSLTNKNMEDCILGNYPSREAAIKLAEEGKLGSIAISRYFAITNDFELLYKNNKVGMLNPDNGVAILTKSMRHTAFLLEN